MTNLGSRRQRARAGPVSSSGLASVSKMFGRVGDQKCFVRARLTCIEEA
jgi:hypothetical protein